MANSIAIEGVHAAYGAVRGLEDVTLTVAGGETVVLLGTNGNGKSTLMKSIMGIVQLSAGRIICEGTPSQIVANGDVQKAYLGA